MGTVAAAMDTGDLISGAPQREQFEMPPTMPPEQMQPPPEQGMMPPEGMQPPPMMEQPQ
jgi:hypothetical protein